jgi:hypothetical protein
MHIPKTGGTSINTLLHDYGLLRNTPENCIREGHVPDTIIEANRNSNDADQSGQQHHVMSCETPVDYLREDGLDEVFRPDCYIAVTRDPLLWVVSSINHMIYDPNLSNDTSDFKSSVRCQ